MFIHEEVCVVLESQCLEPCGVLIVGGWAPSKPLEPGPVGSALCAPLWVGSPTSSLPSAPCSRSSFIQSMDHVSKQQLRVL